MTEQPKQSREELQNKLKQKLLFHNTKRLTKFSQEYKFELAKQKLCQNGDQKDGDANQVD